MPAFIKRALAFVQSEPATLAAIIQAVAVLIIMRYHLTPDQAAAVEAVAAATLGLAVAALTRPFRVQAVSGFATAASTLIVAFSWHFSASTISITNVAIAAVLLLLREPKTITLAEHRAARARLERHP